ncbi:hypothetical protein [Longimicrobium terrae]|uniref:Uncharacterized protein n=1 Tax=Longimicrobium terrae TaxID=1639882 RepID=A0A841GT04_9BACT|nr:hypothetical protein [Longimicrobium terrae]MBB4635185.1 hypothetical protein [Longimicrobium terrae]MBB6069579.1 hypothetical protein [Longimicrobium terrae]NNC31618.1 hypothetical protein [Longimicrobium terrae]
MPEAVGTFPRMVGAYPDGSLLLASDAAASNTAEFKTGVRRERSALLRVSPAGALIGQVAEVPSTEQYASVSPDGRGFRLQSLPFGRRTVMAISGNDLYVGTGEDAAIRAFGLDGSSRHLLRVPADRKRVAAADINQYWKRLVTSGSSRDGEGPPPGEIPYPDALPPYAALNVDRAGRLWVGESRLPREWDQPATWWVFRPDGALAATIRIPGRMHVLEIGEDWLLGREMDADERETVSLYRFRPAR